MSKGKVYNLLHKEDVHLEKVAGSRTTALKVRYTKIIHLGWKNWQNFVKIQ